MLPLLNAAGVPNQVGKAAIIGWRDVLAPALLDGGPVSLWPFDGALPSLLVPGNVVIAETYPAECYGWFDGVLGSKDDQDKREKFGASLIRWLRATKSCLRIASLRTFRAASPQER